MIGVFDFIVDFPGDPLPSDRSISSKTEGDSLVLHGRQRQSSDPGTNVGDLEDKVDKGTISKDQPSYCVTVQ